MRTRPQRIWSGALLLAGVACGLAGAALVVAALTTPSRTFGWFAYAPLAEAAFLPGGGLPAAGDLFGYGLAVVGLVILAWSLGRGRYPRGPVLPHLPHRVKLVLGSIAAAATLAVLAGGATLLASPPGFDAVPVRPAPGQELSVVYSSDLTITLDDAYGPTMTPGLLLLVGGLCLCAAVTGWRTVQPGMTVRGLPEDGRPDGPGGPGAPAGTGA